MLLNPSASLAIAKALFEAHANANGGQFFALARNANGFRAKFFVTENAAKKFYDPDVEAGLVIRCDFDQVSAMLKGSTVETWSKTSLPANLAFRITSNISIDRNAEMEA